NSLPNPKPHSTQRFAFGQFLRHCSSTHSFARGAKPIVVSEVQGEVSYFIEGGQNQGNFRLVTVTALGLIDDAVVAFKSKDLDTASINLSATLDNSVTCEDQFKDKKVLVDSFASWCGKDFNSDKP
ncbi:uncharacterized protein LOC114410688, partial [Glycine soja]|uniref:uncharacterized protein LOC114410688 n=1 Tax=Glycine soja TaxID=3848 RepID=UPI00103B4C51